MTLPRWLACSMLLAVYGQVPPPAPAPQQTPPVFRSGIDLVRLDVSVLDADRRPVRDLAAADFTILVDGVPQPIVAFVPVVIPPPEQPTAPWMREVAPDVRTNALGEPRLFVIIMDDAMTPADPFMVETAKTIARRVVEELGPGDLAAVLFTLEQRWSQDLTSDRARLLEAIEHFNFGMGGGLLPGIFPTRTLEGTVSLLRDRPQGRNAIIFIGTGIGPVRTGPQPLRNKGDSEPLLSIMDVGELARSARLARVPVYWFNIVGLEAPRGTRTEIAWPSWARGTPLGMIADESGGRAIVDTNAPAVAVPEVFDENSAYYLVGYKPTYPLADGRTRRLEIKVARPGVTVSPGDRLVRSAKPKPTKAKTSLSPLLSALTDLLPQSDVPLTMSVAPFAIPGGGGRGVTAALAVSVGVSQPAPSAPLVEHVEVLGKVFTLSGKSVTSVKQDVTLRLVPAAEDTRYEVLSRLDLEPGRYVLRVSARSATLDRTGSVYADVTVPDFTKPALAFSGIVISAAPAPRAAPTDALASLIPVVPTTAREFTSSHTATAFVRLYQGGKRALAPVELFVRLTNGRDQIVSARQEDLPPARFGAGRAADYTYEVPLARLEPGPYLLTLTALAGKAAPVRADVRITVR